MAFVFTSSFSASSFVTLRRCGFTPSTDVRRVSPPTLAKRTPIPVIHAKETPSESLSTASKPQSRPVIAIVGKKPQSENLKEVTVDVSALKKGLFGIRANAYWESMGVLPLFFAGFGITALAIKLLKIKGGQLRGGDVAKKMSVPKTAITSEAEEAELHVFKCGGCGYEMYPARGREFKFFPDSFKCPLCGTPKSEFWDLNDPTDPRNQTDDEDDEDDGDDGQGTPGPAPVAPTPGAAVQSIAEDPIEPTKMDKPQS